MAAAVAGIIFQALVMFTVLAAAAVDIPVVAETVDSVSGVAAAAADPTIQELHR
jgi:NAD/NADP transhydrogenase beta subunit